MAIDLVDLNMKNRSKFDNFSSLFLLKSDELSVYPPIIRVRLSNDIIKIHFRLAAIDLVDLDMKNGDILLFFLDNGS